MQEALTALSQSHSASSQSSASASSASASSQRPVPPKLLDGATGSEEGKPDGWAPLHFACNPLSRAHDGSLRDKQRCVRLLAEAPANVNVQDGAERTPWLTAAGGASVALMKTLVEAAESAGQQVA